MDNQIKNTEKNSKIAIIGAGPGGLAAAERLKDKGYTNITVFEKRDRIGGMSLSKTYKADNGKEIVYDMGSIQPMGGSEFKKLVTKYGLHWGRGISIDKTKLMRFYDFDKREYTADFVKYLLGYPIIKWPGLFLDMIKLSIALFRMRRFYAPGFAKADYDDGYIAELSHPVEEWIDSLNLKVCKNELKFSVCAVGTGTTLALGLLEPGVYVPKILLQFLHFPFRYIDGSYKPIREGYQSVWNMVAKNHDVRLSSKIKKIERKDGKVIIVHNNNKKEEFDQLIIAFSLDLAKDIMEFTDNEKKVVSYIIHAPVWRMAFVAEGLPKDSTTLFPESYYSQKSDRMPIGMMVPEGDIDEKRTLYSCTFQPLARQIDDTYLNEVSKKLSEHFGGRIIEWVDKQFWPHYHGMITTEGMKNRAFETFEQMQGHLNTYYVGEILTDSGHAEIVRYSYGIVDKFWS